MKNTKSKNTDNKQITAEDVFSQFMGALPNLTKKSKSGKSNLFASEPSLVNQMEMFAHGWASAMHLTCEDQDYNQLYQKVLEAISESWMSQSSRDH